MSRWLGLRNAIFDLDGTLVDSSGDIVASLAEAYSRCNLAGVANRLTPALIGPPLREMVASLSPELSDPQRDLVVATFREIYNACRFEQTFVYRGIHDLLTGLVDNGIRIFITTNKPALPTQKILETLGLTLLVTDLATFDRLPPQQESKSEMVQHIMALWRLEVSDTVLVGDSASDIYAAHGQGLPSVGVLYGYGEAAEIRQARPMHVVSGVAELRTVLMDQLASPRADGRSLGTAAPLAAKNTCQREVPCFAAKAGRSPSVARYSLEPSDSLGSKSMNDPIFDELFVLEMANNHCGDLQRGLKIIRDYGQVVRFNNIKAAIKVQFRNVETFIHKQFRERTDIRYIKKTLDTKLSKADFAHLVQAVRRHGCIPAATPFDEASVDMCVELGIQIIKLASSDLNDWVLIEKIAKTRKPVIASLGGTSLKDAEDLVTFFTHRHIPLAINHCTSIYPTEDDDLELNQIDFLRSRFPNQVVGFSTHEYHDWVSSMLVAYAKGARTFERHVDIDCDGVPVSPYCSLPHQIDAWFKAFKHAKRICGGRATYKRTPPDKETKYLDSLVRGVYAARDLPEGHVLTDEDIYLAIPLQKGQISCRELMHDETLLKTCGKDQPVMIDMIDGPYAKNEKLTRWVYERGL